MNADALLEMLRAEGVDLRTENGQLHYTARKGKLTQEIKSLLVAHKPEIIAYLQQKKPAPPAPRTGSRSARLTVKLDPDEVERSAPYVRFVNPHIGISLARLNLDKNFVRGEGCWLYDSEGQRYLDFIAQYGALPFGYNPPEIWQAMERVRLDSVPNFVQPSILGPAGEMAERLLRVAPKGMKYVTFSNSGTEAVEAAIKLARSATGRLGILATRHGFHGKTLGSVSATGSSIYQEAFGAPVSGFTHIPFGDIDALTATLRANPTAYAAFVVEPIQGEGGIVVPPAGYLAQAHAICQETGTLFVLDEVQSGLGRTGQFFAAEHERVCPDIMTLAKALGGGLMPIGACLYKENVYNAEFALRHSSTFAGNALACNAAIATLDLLERSDGALMRRVAENGERMLRSLEALKQKHGDVIKSVRGRGYMLGVELNLEAETFSEGLFGCLRDEGLLSYAISAYLLNVEHVRVAPTESAAGVLRIEPPLIVDWEQCETFLTAFERTLDVISRRDAAQLMAHVLGIKLDPDDRRDWARPVLQETKPADGDARFAFLIHLTHPGDYVNLDPSLRRLDQSQILRLRDRGAGLMAPFRISSVMVESKTGQRAYGEFIAVPYTASELVEMPPERAVMEIARGVEMAGRRGAQIVGLGGFNSVATLGGLALRGHGLCSMTTGNSFTAVAARRGVEAALRKRGRTLGESTIAVVGAGGAVGRATATLLSSEVKQLVLVGNPAHPDRSMSRLLEVATGILTHLWDMHSRHKFQFMNGTLGRALVEEKNDSANSPNFEAIAAAFLRKGDHLSTSTDFRSSLLAADVIITATSAVDCILDADMLKQDAIVCELSRPFNASEEVKAARPDVAFTEGGLVRVPSEPDMGWDLGQPCGIVYACMAETMMLALEKRFQDTSLGGNLNIGEVHKIEALADKHGFVVEC